VLSQANVIPQNVLSLLRWWSENPPGRCVGSWGPAQRPVSVRSGDPTDSV